MENEQDFSQFNFYEQEYIKCALDPDYYLNNYGYVFNAKTQFVDKMTTFKYQTKCVKRFHKYQNTIILKSRQCIPKGTFIDTPYGCKKIEEFRENDPIYSYNFKIDKIEEDKVHESWNSGMQQCVKIYLKDKRILEVGENHPLFIIGKGWVQAGELNRGDEIMDLNFIGNKEGFENVNSLFNKETEKFDKGVFQAGEKIISSVIKNIFDNKSWVNTLKNTITNEKQIEIGITSSNIEFLNNLRFLLKKLKIKSNVEDISSSESEFSAFKHNKKKELSKLIISQSVSICNFFNKVGILKKVNKEFIELYQNKGNNKSESIVKKIKFSGEKECYDISVLNNENFLIDGLLVHNTGLSVVTAGYAAWRAMFIKDEKILIIANDATGAIRFLETIKQFVEHTPDWLKPNIVTNNTKKIEFDNKSWIQAKASSKQAGRGDSLTMLILDETAFIEHADSIWMGAGMALSTTKGKAIFISCVPKDTFVFTDKGIKQVSQFIDQDKVGGYEIPEYKVLGKDKLRIGNLFFNNGFKETRKITTTFSKFEGTLNHKLWASKKGNYGWYKTKELEVGDTIAFQFGKDIWGNNDDVSDFRISNQKRVKNRFQPETITKEIAYLLGLFISGGKMIKEIPKSIVKKRFKYKDAISIKSEFNIGESIRNAGLEYTLVDKEKYLINDPDFKEFLQYLGFDLSGFYGDVSIPERLMEMSKENIVYFIRGMFDVNCFIDKQTGYIFFAKLSSKLVEQTRMMLMNLGILSTYFEAEDFGNFRHIYKEREVCKVYRLSIKGIYARKFYEKVRFDIKEKQIYYKIIKSCEVKDFATNNIANGYFIGRKIMSESGFSNRELRQNGINNYFFLNPTCQFVPKRMKKTHLTKLFEYCKHKLSEDTIQLVNDLLDGTLTWEEITNIEESSCETYDFSLPNDENDPFAHSVIYNGYLGHQTPNGSSGLYAKTWSDAIAGDNDFHPIKVHWTENPICIDGLETRKTDNGEEILWSPWYEEQRKRLQYDNVKIAQELDLSFEGSKHLVFGADTIQKYEAKLKTDIHKAVIKNAIYFDYLADIENQFVSKKTDFIIYKKPKPGGSYVIGGDVARGDGSDFSTLQIIDAETLEQVGEYRGKCQPDDFAKIIYQIGKAYNTAYLAIEANNFGLATTIDLNRKLGYKNMYFSKSIKDMHVTFYNFKVDQDEDIPGWQTTPKTRPLIIAHLSSHLRNGEIIIYSQKLTQEFWNFIQKGDKPQAEKGFHDDLIMAFAIALYIRDNEFKKIMNSTRGLVGMLDSIGFSATRSDGKVINNMTIEEIRESEENISKNSSVAGIYATNEIGTLDEVDNDDDLSWLIG